MAAAVVSSLGARRRLAVGREARNRAIGCRGGGPPEPGALRPGAGTRVGRRPCRRYGCEAARGAADGRPSLGRGRTMHAGEVLPQAGAGQVVTLAPKAVFAIADWPAAVVIGLDEAPALHRKTATSGQETSRRAACPRQNWRSRRTVAQRLCRRSPRWSRGFFAVRSVVGRDLDWARDVGAGGTNPVRVRLRRGALVRSVRPRTFAEQRSQRCSLRACDAGQVCKGETVLLRTVISAPDPEWWPDRPLYRGSPPSWRICLIVPAWLCRSARCCPATPRRPTWPPVGPRACDAPKADRDRRA